MSRSGRFSVAACLAVLGLLTPLASSPARGQFRPAAIELSSAVTLDEADSSVRAHLERVKAYVADHQWDEAVETLRQLMEDHGGEDDRADARPLRQPGAITARCKSPRCRTKRWPCIASASTRWPSNGTKRASPRRDPARLAKLRRQDVLQLLGRRCPVGFGRNRARTGALRRGPRLLGTADRVAAGASAGRSFRSGPRPARLVARRCQAARHLVRARSGGEAPGLRAARRGRGKRRSSRAAGAILEAPAVALHASGLSGQRSCQSRRFERGWCWCRSWKARWPAREASYGHSNNFIPEPRGGWPDAK